MVVHFKSIKCLPHVILYNESEKRLYRNDLEHYRKGYVLLTLIETKNDINSLDSGVTDSDVHLVEKI